MKPSWKKRKLKADIKRSNHLKHQLKKAPTFEKWQETAEELDKILGHDEWKRTPTSHLYDNETIEADIRKLRKERSSGNQRALMHYIRQGLHRNRGNIGNPALYEFCFTGTKYLLDDYIKEVIQCLNYITDSNDDVVDIESKIGFIANTQQSFGKSSLLLSGGANLGVFHIGVAKALWQRGLLPRVLSGASAGSVVAALLGTLPDNQLPYLFDTKKLPFDTWKRLPFQEILSTKAAFCAPTLKRKLKFFLRNMTFAEAYEKTGRIINISVTNADRYNDPKLLNYLTTPHVLIWSACLASCAMFGLYPAAELMQKDSKGKIVPYMPGKLWLDGSLRNDLPKERLAELYNINNYIVSQANPYIIPFLSDPASRGKLHNFLGSLVYGELNLRLKQMGFILTETNQVPSLVSLVDTISAVVQQQYHGDITLYPRVNLAMYRQLFSNLPQKKVNELVLQGERAVWDKLNFIQNQTKIAQTLDRCLRRLKNPGKWITDTAI